MKITISGTHSTGKTTFLDQLIKEVAPTPIHKLSSLAPEARDLGFPILKEHTFNSTLWMMATGMKKEAESTLKNSITLVDRPIMEAHAYLNAALKLRGERLTDAEEACLLSISKGYMFSYDMIIKTIVDDTLPIATNKKRDHDAEFRKMVDCEIDTLYAQLGVSFIPLRVNDNTVLAEVIKMIKGKS